MLSWALGMAAVGLLLLGIARRSRVRGGIPSGRVAYLDLANGEGRAVVLHDPELGLKGRPDALLAARGGVVPLEVKSGRAPRRPHESHVLQLAAYCRLAQVHTGRRPAHGVLQYADRAFWVDYTPALERRLRETVAAIYRTQGKPPRRSHESSLRCRSCGYRGVCDQRLRYNTDDA